MSLAVAHLLIPPSARGTSTAHTQTLRKRHAQASNRQQQQQQQQQQQEGQVHGSSGERTAMEDEEAEGSSLQPELLHATPGAESPHTVVRAGEGRVTRVVVFNPLAQEMHQVRGKEER